MGTPISDRLALSITVIKSLRMSVSEVPTSSAAEGLLHWPVLFLSMVSIRLGGICARRLVEISPSPGCSNIVFAIAKWLGSGQDSEGYVDILAMRVVVTLGFRHVTTRAGLKKRGLILGCFGLELAWGLAPRTHTGRST